ncbi:MAG: TAXI family TRAP transporter solute-binding subunit, partial [Dehalobacterium sp.]
MRKRALLVSLLLVSIIFFVGCGTNNQPAQDNTSTEGNQPAQESTNKEEKQEKIYLRWFAGATTSNWYPISVAVGGKVEKAMPNVITTVGPGGGKDNPVFVGKGEAQLGWSYSTDVVAAYNGLAPYDQKYTNIRHVATLWTAPLATAVKSDSNIKNWKDLIGKKIALGPATFAGNVLGRRILESYGIDEEKMKQNGGRIDNLDS